MSIGDRLVWGIVILAIVGLWQFYEDQLFEVVSAYPEVPLFLAGWLLPTSLRKWKSSKTPREDSTAGTTNDDENSGDEETRVIQPTEETKVLAEIHGVERILTALGILVLVLASGRYSATRSLLCIVAFLAGTGVKAIITRK